MAKLVSSKGTHSATNESRANLFSFLVIALLVLTTVGAARPWSRRGPSLAAVLSVSELRPSVVIVPVTVATA